MKKTLLVLLTLGAIASGADTKEELWSIDFTTLNRTESGQAITFGDYTFKVWDGTLSSAGITSNYTPATTTTNDAGETVESSPAEIDRVHITGPTGVTWGDNFAVEVVFTLPDGYDKAGDWPAIFNMYGNGNNDNLRFGPYVQDSSYGIDGVSNVALVKPGESDRDWTSVPLTTGEAHTALLSVYDGAVTLTIDGAIAAKATLNTSNDYYAPSIEIGNMLIGGHVGNNYGADPKSAWNMDVTVSSLTMYKLVPEPTTATLSLLALAGLAARRRRK